MKLVLIFAITLMPTAALAKGQLVAEPLNSPVKERYAKFSLSGIEQMDKVFFKPKNGNEEVEGKLEFSNGVYIGKYKASELPVGSHEIRIRVTTNSGKSHQDNAKSVAWASISIDPSLEVADPGEAGLKTLTGIDTDKNGVRDDVQRWIAEQALPNNHKNALRQMARKYQERIVLEDDAVKGLEATKKSIDAGFCLMQLLNDNFQAASMWLKQLEAEFYNTKDRISSDLKIREFFQGASNEVYKEPTSALEKCEFELN